MMHSIELTHPDKVLYPEQGVTKQDLAEFYESIFEYILPHITRRPISLVRCPRGRQKKCFYQKHINETTPKFLRGITIEEKEKTDEYIVIDDLKGLLSLVQMGMLEIHPWGASEKNIEKPDTLTFDLDPAPEVEWGGIVEAARLLHSRLKELGLKSFLKTSGGKGLHIVVPIQRKNNWDEAKAFTKAIAEEVVKQYPERYIATMSKQKRKGKIFIDYLRNSRGATSVAAYSTRARKNAPVSTPIRWDELSKSLTPDSYTIQNLPRRLKSLKKDPWEDYFDVRQSITNKIKKELGIN